MINLFNKIKGFWKTFLQNIKSFYFVLLVDFWASIIQIIILIFIATFLILKLK